MSFDYVIMAFVALVVGTQICRFIPYFLPKFVLESAILQKLNDILPLVILVLLVITSLKLPESKADLSYFFAQLLALGCVILSYKWLNNILLSVVVGIASINFFVWVM